jgi:RNA polymerase sigma-70 factor (ECF subfamily)
MDDERDYIELVKQARLGDRKSLDKLAGLVRGRLYAYVRRILLDEHLAQDIVQESMLEMFKVLGSLDREEQFWPWLRGIAFNKIRRHHAQKQRHSSVPISNIKEPEGEQSDKETGLAKLVAEELKQTVLAAMRELKPRHRKVLTMRCYEEMEYSEIANLMGCSELGVRVLFHRAKRSLQKALSRKGLEKGFLLTALVLFGKMTAPSEAAAAEVSVTVASTKVGTVAVLLGLAGSKTSVVSLATAGVLATGIMVINPAPETSTALSGEKRTHYVHSAPEIDRVKQFSEECWYYFPESAGGPVMMRTMKSDSDTQQTHCARRQNERANYYFDRAGNTLHINNYRMWRSDLGVWRLPTDRPRLAEFISKVEGRPHQQMEYVPSRGQGLLVIAGQSKNGDANRSRIIRHRHILDEEYFRYDWPAGIKTVDNRDPMHKRGWTYLRVSGQINGERVSGVGRIPFVYAVSKKYSPWLRLEVGNRLRIVDTGDEALVYDYSNNMVASYAAGTFFKGLARPWMGLHTIDIVRRDAAEQQLWFQTKYEPAEQKAEVILTGSQDRLVYTIDMQQDVVDKITFSTGAGQEGELRFSYMQEVEDAGDEFVEPLIRKSYGSKRRESPGMLWLVRLAKANLGR